MRAGATRARLRAAGRASVRAAGSRRRQEMAAAAQPGADQRLMAPARSSRGLGAGAKGARWQELRPAVWRLAVTGATAGPGAAAGPVADFSSCPVSSSRLLLTSPAPSACADLPRAGAPSSCILNDISELNLPKSTSISFPNGKDDLMNFEIIVRPDEGYYLGGTFVFTFQVSPYPHEPPKVKCNTKV
ncbi:uncharacterized protein LOC102712353 [Oryza brachyantha]|uniref:uncharacterized protein LOC102712353 n=1 Tax=Oryza brachyantha TaxID=4533 RepID=UPI001ADA24C1|nr:uncharacterized protein LOC102712353 [Oryza brachyantha]